MLQHYVSPFAGVGKGCYPKTMSSNHAFQHKGATMSPHEFQFNRGITEITSSTTIVFTRLGSPEGGRPIFPGPWPENCALPACAADLVPDAAAETQTPSGA